MEEKYVTEEVCGERQKNAAERFSRDKERLDLQEKKMEKVSDLSIQMGEMLKRHDDELQNHDKRLETLESKPGKLWDTLIMEIIKLLAAGVAGAVIAYLTIKP
jgi:predicted nuclease with TOPRIM domain